MARLLSDRPSLPWYTELLVAAGLSLVSLLYIEYTHNDRQTTERVSKVEVRVEAAEKKAVEDKAETQYVRQRVDAIYNKLLDWEHATPAK